jgi:hypothetical protein
LPLSAATAISAARRKGSTTIASRRSALIIDLLHNLLLRNSNLSGVPKTAVRPRKGLCKRSNENVPAFQPRIEPRESIGAGLGFDDEIAPEDRDG